MLLEYGIDLLGLVPAKGDWANSGVWIRPSKGGPEKLDKFIYALIKPLTGQNCFFTRKNIRDAFMSLVNDKIHVRTEYPQNREELYYDTRPPQ